MTTALPPYDLSLRPDVMFDASNEGYVQARANEGAPVWMKRPSPAVMQALDRLREMPAGEHGLTDAVLRQDGPAGLMGLYVALTQLSQQGWLCYTLSINDKPFATLVPHTHRFKYVNDAVAIVAGCRYVLSRFGYVHVVDGQFVAESPLGQAALVMKDARAHRIVAALAEPADVEGVAARIPDLTPDDVRRFMNMLALAGVLVQVDAHGTSADEADAALSHWEFHDLLFHSKSRLGRQHAGYGGTFRMLGKAEPLPAHTFSPDGEIVSLRKPDMADLLSHDAPFTAVLERRRSIRTYAEQPITVDQLGEFLYRAAHVQQGMDDPAHGTQHSLRPSPNGGAIHELEIYPIVNRCDGLDAGLYHYDACKHHLRKVADKSKFVEGLIYSAWLTANRESPVQVCLAITARFHRTQWKYQSIAYALHLKHVGVLYQTMYLVATAMGLAPCALGGGDSDLFALATGSSYYTETTVGEFLLGSQPGGRNE